MVHNLRLTHFKSILFKELVPSLVRRYQTLKMNCNHGTKVYACEDRFHQSCYVCNAKCPKCMLLEMLQCLQTVFEMPRIFHRQDQTDLATLLHLSLPLQITL